MKTDAYTKTVLTAIAILLLLSLLVKIDNKVIAYSGEPTPVVIVGIDESSSERWEEIPVTINGSVGVEVENSVLFVQEY